MPKITREINDKTLGGRLEQFRPKPKRGRVDFTDAEWAEEIGISAKQLGVMLKNKANVTAPFIQEIVYWLIHSDYTPEDVVWWLSGGKRPKVGDAVKQKPNDRSGGNLPPKFGGKGKLSEIRYSQ